MADAIVVHKLEQFLAGQMLAGPDQLCQPAVLQIDRALARRSCHEIQSGSRANDFHMLIAQCGQSYEWF